MSPIVREMASELHENFTLVLLTGIALPDRRHVPHVGRCQMRAAAHSGCPDAVFAGHVSRLPMDRGQRSRLGAGTAGAGRQATATRLCVAAADIMVAEES